MQMSHQAKSSVTSSLEKVQAGKEKKEQELAAAQHALEEANNKLQVCLPPQTVCWKLSQLLSLALSSNGTRLLHEPQCTSAVVTNARSISVCVCVCVCACVRAFVCVCEIR